VARAAGQPHSAIETAFGASPSMFALGQLAGASAAGSTGTQTEISDLTVSVDPSELVVPGDLLVGLYGASVLGAGLTKLTFEIERGSTVLDAQSFTSVSAAQTYFSHDELNLGSVMTGLNSNGLLDLTFKLGVTEAGAGAGFSFGLLVGDPPAAGSAACLPSEHPLGWAAMGHGA